MTRTDGIALGRSLSRPERFSMSENASWYLALIARDWAYPMKCVRGWWERRSSGTKHWPLEFEFGQRSSLLASPTHREVQLLVWNRRQIWPATNLRIVIESLERKDAGPTIQSAQFSMMPLRTER